MRQRILIIKLGALGDVMLATPHIERIIEGHSDGDISILTAPAYADIFGAHPDLHVAAFPRKGYGAMLAAIRWVRRQGFSVVYDLQGSERSYLLTRLSGARVRVGLGPGYIYSHTVPTDDHSSHIFDRLNRLLEVAGLQAAEPTPVVHVAGKDKNTVSESLSDDAWDNKPIVLIHAGSSSRWPSKRWEEHHYQVFARKLRERGYQVIWTGSDSDAGLNKRLAAVGGIDASGQFSIPQLAALARHAKFALTTDSGPMHVFSSAGIPVYALFGPTDWRRCYAAGQESRVLYHAVPCSPCYQGVCPPEYAHCCMRGLTPECVLGRLREDALI